ncbi:hypothetical protein CQP30_06430 [Yersinia pestis]|uniref:Uncharacterized protein n=5 Tax=Yersinia pestis TaxID=632 RepID=A0A0H2W8R6_YERPE|nr:hypothetical [Yersinia pestis KIM10+]AAS64018.1 hypothetical protein YP_3873 [Yersinia pestis biovar Microtus str. 91001]ADW00732.1 hypothetical protein YPC_4334 [Yersinia pestis biovar Medievalis str. Harbin 35]AYW83909.1 hypothetical protein EGX42_13700 [Yersinia pestis]EEO74377.1 hypothetical protein YP516_3973 [Yersinia pestis Nepal516]EEO79410.1 hypothetical protein YPF_4342 [Yersinia pestis biovar Orientalis str. India 195]EEO85693.1 hypothetical protein YPH_1561 [Yersinia pestis bio
MLFPYIDILIFYIQENTLHHYNLLILNTFPILNREGVYTRNTDFLKSLILTAALAKIGLTNIPMLCWH